MNEPPSYRRAEQAEGGKRRPPRPRQLLITGSIITVVGVALLPLAWLIGAYVGRFIVAFALVGLFFGGALMLNGIIDWIKEGKP